MSSRSCHPLFCERGVHFRTHHRLGSRFHWSNVRSSHIMEFRFSDLGHVWICVVRPTAWFGCANVEELPPLHEPSHNKSERDPSVSSVFASSAKNEEFNASSDRHLVVRMGFRQRERSMFHRGFAMQDRDSQHRDNLTDMCTEVASAIQPSSQIWVPCCGVDNWS